MKSTFAPRIARALAPFLAATALVSIPAYAQDTTGQAAPVITPPSSATVPIPPVVRTVPDGAPAPVADAPARTAPRAAPAPRAATRSTTRTTVTRAAPAAPAPVAAAPVAPPPAAPAEPIAAAPPPPVAAPAQPAPAPAADSALTGSSTTTTASTIPLWAWLAGGIAVLAIILGAVLAMRRRRPEYEYDEPAYVEDTYVEPAPVAVAPIAAAPIVEPVAVAKPAPRKEPEYLRRSEPLAEPAIAAPDEVHVESAARDDVAALTAGEDHAERPWLEFAMRPVRAGTNVDEALVEIELTVGNAGSVDAKDVRISTFLLSGDLRSSEMERLLTTPPADSSTDPVTIKPGEGKRIDATLALLKSDMGEILPDSIRPIVVADARYTMADGSEGRTSASFVIGVTPDEGTGLEPLEMKRSSMHDNVGAELHGEPQHA